VEVSATPVDGDQLPCGTFVDDLLEQVADRRPASDPAHQAGCVHCRAALAELAELWAPVHHAATERVRMPAGLLDRVMSAVRDLAVGGHRQRTGADADRGVGHRRGGPAGRRPGPGRLLRDQPCRRPGD